MKLTARILAFCMAVLGVLFSFRKEIGRKMLVDNEVKNQNESENPVGNTQTITISAGRMLSSFLRNFSHHGTVYSRDLLPA